MRAFAPLMALCGTPAFAHHSFAMFDRKAEIVLTGTVTQFQWKNPHTYIQLLSDKDKQDWTIEAGGVSYLDRLGWRRNSLHAGDKITVHAHPLRNGAAGAELIWVVKPDGTKLVGSPESSENRRILESR